MSEPTVDPRAVTPVYGWHVPVLGDVPNIPADITALATGIEATVQLLAAPVPLAHLLWGSGSLPSGLTRMTAAAQKITLGGITADTATGLITLPQAGVYAVFFTASLYGLGTTHGTAAIGDDVQIFSSAGALGASHAPWSNSYSYSPGAALAEFPAGQKLGLWVEMGQAAPRDKAELAVHWVGPAA